MSCTPRAIYLSQQEVEIFSSYKYRGTVIDQKLSFTENVDFDYKKAHKKKKRQKIFSGNLKVLTLSWNLYTEAWLKVSSLSTFEMVWQSDCQKQNKAKLHCQYSQEIVGSRQLQLSQLYQVSVKYKTRQILNDTYLPS